jgi:serine/tyrosine/threonine adenylyltransferase
MTLSASLGFENRFVDLLPGDKESKNFCRQVFDACYSKVKPTPVADPKVVAYSQEVVELLDLPESWITGKEAAETLGGNRLMPGMDPYAMCYGGHQFGNWAGQLGDGRAINLGERVNSQGQRWVLQLKGSGVTPYSRHADGLAVLRSSIREFLCSEAMHHLGVPTTRALSLVLTGDQVTRDMFYDGNPQREPGAIVCRVAPSFVRFGNFEIFAARQDTATLRKLMDFTIREYFPNLVTATEQQAETLSTETYIRWFDEVCRRTAEMVVHWMRVGFVHGVMNTDNMSILGLTIDYGPYGWLEDYEPTWTPNTTDASGRRYCFGQQPQIAMWNCAQLANAIWPVVQQEEPLRESLKNYSETFEAGWQTMMAGKLGLRSFEVGADESLVEGLLKLLNAIETDMTLFYRQLASLPVKSNLDHNRRSEATADDGVLESLISHFSAAYYDSRQISKSYKNQMGQWFQKYRNRILRDGTDDATRQAAMNRVNPIYVLRNYLAQQAIDKSERGDHSMIFELLDVLRNPCQVQQNREIFAEKRPEWARNRAGCSMLSCSS